VIGEGGVAILARIVDAAAFHLDRNNVVRSAIVFAAALRIEIYATHVSNGRGHLRP
jgi:hypothetical protein